MPLFVSERGSRHERIWEQTRLNAGWCSPTDIGLELAECDISCLPIIRISICPFVLPVVIPIGITSEQRLQKK